MISKLDWCVCMLFDNLDFFLSFHIDQSRTDQSVCKQEERGSLFVFSFVLVCGSNFLFLIVLSLFVWECLGKKKLKKKKKVSCCCSFSVLTRPFPKSYYCHYCDVHLTHDSIGEEFFFLFFFFFFSYFFCLFHQLCVVLITLVESTR